MKKYFAKTFMSLCALGISSVAFAQEATFNSGFGSFLRECYRNRC